MRENDVKFMREALKLAKTAYEEEEIPVGAVIVYDKKVIARGYNQVERLRDPTAHAEILAITSAARYLGSKWLYKCALYVTLEPCTMCAGALVLSRIDKVIFGAEDSKTGAFGSKVDINELNLNHKIKVRSGVMKEECSKILQDFFEKKRRQKGLAKFKLY